MKFFRQFKRTLRRLSIVIFPISEKMERFTRYAAWKMNGQKLTLMYTEAYDTDILVIARNGCEDLVIYVPHGKPIPIDKDGKVLLQYRQEPLEELIGLYGRYRYRNQVTAYLTIR